jgi:hypothetical protein
VITKVRPVVTAASCDACTKQLPFIGNGVEHGVLQNNFGYDTPELDPLGEPRHEAHLCQACYVKACAAVGLNPLSLLRKGEEPTT